MHIRDQYFNPIKIQLINIQISDTRQSSVSVEQFEEGLIQVSVLGMLFDFRIVV
jgi:hypothetical protein